MVTTKKNQKGIATLEVLIAMVVIILALTAVLPLVFSGQNSTVSSQTNQEALYKAQASLENARILDFSAVANKTETDGFYTTNLIVNQLNSFTKQLSSLVTFGTGQQVTLSTTITDPYSALGICNPSLADPDAWKTPQIYFNQRLGDLVGGSHSNGLGIGDIKVYQGKLYIAASSSTNSDYKFYVFSLPNDPEQPPVFLGGVNTSSTTSAGLASVAVSGNYAYVANAYTGSNKTCLQADNCAQLQIIDISNPMPTSWNPTVTNLKIPAVASGNKLAPATSVFYSNGYVYVGLAQASVSGSEFNIVDVGGGGLPASPTNPILRGTFTLGRGVNAITVKGDYAYIAHPANSSDPYKEQLTVLDISDKNNPIRPTKGFYKAPDFQGNGNSLFLSADKIYFGRTVTTTANPEFYILNNSLPANLSTNNTSPYGKKINDSVIGLSVRGNNSKNLAFLTTNNQFQVLDITTPSAITTFGTPISFSSVYPGSSFNGSTATNCTGNYFYLGNHVTGNSKDYLAIIGP